MHIEERTFGIGRGETAFCRIWTPDSPAVTREALLLLHGAESNGEWFSRIVQPLIEAGYSVYAPDRPGWGRSGGLRGHLQSYDYALSFLDEIVDHIRKQHDRVHVTGMSWGGKLALYAAIRRPLLFDSLTLLAPGIAPLHRPHWIHMVRIALSLSLGNGTATIPLPFRDSDFSQQKDSLRFIRGDALRVRRVTARFCLEDLKMRKFLEEHVGRLRTPVRLLTVEGDPVVDSAAAQTLLDQIPERLRRLDSVNDSGHAMVLDRPQKVIDTCLAQAQEPWPEHPSPKRILIFGAGAVGGLVGGLLAKGGHQVTLLGRDPLAEAVSKRGLAIELNGCTGTIRRNLKVITDASEAQKPDMVLLCVKNFDTGTALDALQGVIAPDTPIISLQNGISSEQRIAEAFPENPVLAGAICAYTSMPRPGWIQWESDRGGLAVAPSANVPEPLFQDILSTLRDSGMEVLGYQSAESVVWSKLMLNVAFNALNALTGIPAGGILVHRQLGKLAVNALAECARVMRARNIEPVPLPGYDVARLARLMRLPNGLARRILRSVTTEESSGKSSMAQDFLRQRGATEIEEINGAVVAVGRELEIPTPANTLLVEVVRRALADDALREEYRRVPESILGTGSNSFR